MQINNYLKQKMPYLAILMLLIGLSSCGSYQYVGVENDGIYGSSNPQTVVEVQNGNAGNSYYKNYFREKSLEYDYMVNDGSVFTDIDTYQSGYVENDTLIDNNYQGYGGWGQNNNSVTINYIDNGWNNWGWNYWGWNNWAGIGAGIIGVITILGIHLIIMVVIMAVITVVGIILIMGTLTMVMDITEVILTEEEVQLTIQEEEVFMLQTIIQVAVIVVVLLIRLQEIIRLQDIITRIRLEEAIVQPILIQTL